MPTWKALLALCRPAYFLIMVDIFTAVHQDRLGDTRINQGVAQEPEFCLYITSIYLEKPDNIYTGNKT